jgi:serine/threonine-protein kinase
MLETAYLGHYHIETHLGSGRYADVYRAVDTVRKRTVALKVLKPNLPLGRQSWPSFMQQAQLATDLIHPYIAWIWETGEENGVFYLVERFVNGPSFSNLLSESGTMSWDQIHPIIGQVAQGLDFAHGKGWVHGDVKAQNILISPDLGAALTDFGLMRAMQASYSSSTDQSSIGTALYTAPEVRQGQPLSPASDQYSLACVVMEALIGQALPDVPAATVSKSNYKEAIALPISWPANVPWQVRIALERALSSDPTARYPNVGEFVAAPDELAVRVEQTPETRIQWEAETRARLAAEEQSRRQAEELTRLAALEQARREIQEELQHEQQEQKKEGDRSSPPDTREQTTATPPNHRTRKFRYRWRRWPVWVFIGALVMALAGFWLVSLISGSNLLRNTTTPTSPPITATISLTDTRFPTMTPTPSKTPTISPTTAITPTSRPTWTSTPSLTPTITPYPYRATVKERTPARGQAP